MDFRAILKPHSDHEECDECEKLDRNQLHIAVRFVDWLTPYTLFILDYDPFSIYKGTHKQTDRRYELYTCPELRIPLGRVDRLRERWRKIKLFLLLYLTLRHGLSILIQVVVYNKLYGSSSSSPSGEKDSGQVTKPSTTTILVEMGKLEMFLIRLGQLLGNPLSALTGISLFMSCAIILCSLYSLGYMAHKFSVVPMDAVSLRVYMAPAREFRRVDMVIMNKINYIMSHLDASRVQTQKQKMISLRTYLPIITTGRDQKLWGDLVCRQAARTPVVLPLTVCSMRPAIYSQRWYKKNQIRTFWVLFCYGLPAIPVIVYYMPRIILPIAVDSLCRQSRVINDTGTCRWHDVFSVSDVVALIELQMAIILAAFIIGLQIILITTNTWTQFDLSREIAADFRSSLKLLRQSSWLDNIKRERKLDRKEEYELTFRNKLKTDTMLFKTLIKSHVTLVDYRSNSAFITHQVEGVLCVLMVSILLLLLAENLKGLDVTWFRRMTLSVALIVSNAILLSSANSYNYMCQLERLGCSILAELTHRHQRLNYLASVDAEFVPVFWRKLIQSSGLARQTNSIYPFGVCINYKNALQFNFLVVSFFSLLQTF